MQDPGTPASAEARKRILEAAERLFAEKGYAATRVQEITDAAGVNKALLYYYFTDKRSVYVALVEEAIAAFDAMLQEALEAPGAGCAERLRRFVHGHVLLIARRANLQRMIQRSQATGEVEDLGELKKKYRSSLGRLVAFFAEAVVAGEFREVNPEMAALSVIALNMGFAHLQADGSFGFLPEQVAEHSATLLLNGFHKG